MTANHLILPTLPPCCTRLQVSYDTYDLVLVTVAGVHCLLAKNLAEHSTLPKPPMSYQMKENCPEEQGNREMLTLGYPDTTWAWPCSF